MLLQSTAVSIPLTLTQCMTQTIHNLHVSGITPEEFLLNIALSVSIYGNDRRDVNTSSLESSLICISTIGSVGYFASNSYTLPLSFITLYLVYEYKNIKKDIALLKPFFVSFFWVVCTYFQPLFIRNDLNYSKDYPFIVSLFLLFSSLSHIADIPDIVEDAKNHVNTPAVILGEDKSYVFAYGLMIASLLFHQTHGNDLAGIFYDVSSLLIVTSFLESVQLTVFTFSLLVGYYSTHEYFLYDFMTELFRLSDSFHSLATSSLPWIIRNTESFNPNVRKFIITNWMDIMSDGDKIGGKLLNYYTKIVKNTFDFML